MRRDCERAGPLRAPRPGAEIDRLEEKLRATSSSRTTPSWTRSPPTSSTQAESASGPALTLAAALASTATGRARTPCSEGSSVELVHLASLYHDDVMDEATSGATSSA